MAVTATTATAVACSIRSVCGKAGCAASYGNVRRDTDYTKLKAARAEVAELQKIRKCVDIALKAEQPEQTQNRTKRQEQER